MPKIDPNVSKQELENSKRIFKSATPKYTLDWYVKWFATFMIIAAVICRSSGFHLMDLVFSIIGTIGWTFVAIAWHDRALIVLNAVISVILAIGLLEYFSAY
tara:strand:+ start:1654 stop:1959 length:306 start_codon:yes stop_codon:yes gene_type:complete